MSGPIVQRYYDPAIGRFLSVDPVTANSVTGSNFNRYWYADGNPYKFTDPDGRQSREFNLENQKLGIKPPERTGPMSTGEKLIGAGLALVAAPIALMAAGELGMAALANPVATTAIMNEVGAAAGVTGTAAGAGTAAVRSLSAEGKALANAQPVANALKSDVVHRSASFMRQEAAQNGTHSALVGGDGVTRTLTQISGGLNGKAGRFEYIVEKSGDLTHQRFVEGGSLNGVSNKP